MVGKRDELNNVLTDYFSAMDISKDQKADRVGLAADIYLVMVDMFREAQVMNEEENLEDYLFDYLLGTYGNTLSNWKLNHPDLNKAVGDIVNTTVSNTAKFYTSENRAKEIAENEANVVLNYDDYNEAVSNGFTQKKWLTMLDNRVRDSHVSMEGRTIPINDLFEINGSLLAYPCDILHGADASETVNCRCSVEYIQ